MWSYPQADKPGLSEGAPQGQRPCELGDKDVLDLTKGQGNVKSLLRHYPLSLRPMLYNSIKTGQPVRSV